MTIDQVHATEAVAADAAQSSFVAYEYASVRVPRTLQSLHQDAYRGFGWSVEGVELADPVRPLPLTPAIHPTTVVLKLKRDRAIRNRQLVQELQRRAEKSLATISRLERSQRSIALTAAVLFGIVGSALLAGSIFSLNAGLVFLCVLFGAVGLLLWLGGFIAHGVVKNKRAAKVGPLIDREHDVLYETASQASRLLS